MKELNMENKNLLGIIGGLGPMSSAYFYELITTHTLAQKDQEHIDIIQLRTGLTIFWDCLIKILLII